MRYLHLFPLLCLLIATKSLSAGPMETYSFVYILTGPATDIEPAIQQEAFQGHFSNMTRMAEEGDLLIAGPYWQPQTWDDMRGMWIFNTRDLDKASTLAATDPPGKLGIFVFDILHFKTDDPIDQLPRLEKEDEERRLSDPNIPDEWAGRGYFWATAKATEIDEPDRVEGIALLGTLIGHADSRIESDHWLVLLDATTNEDAAKILTSAGCDPEQWSMDEWYGSAMPAKLPSLRD
ncbi:MAG: YciI family protein [Phycisphaerales bacterium]